MGDGYSIVEEQNNDKEWLETWMDTTVENMPNHKKWYKFMCFIMGRKLTYKELYIILCHINNKKGKEFKETQENSMKQIIDIYNFNNISKNY